MIEFVRFGHLGDCVEESWRTNDCSRGWGAHLDLIIGMAVMIGYERDKNPIFIREELTMSITGIPWWYEAWNSLYCLASRRRRN